MDIELNCEQRGSGRPLFLLHGNGESHAYFKNQIGFFSRSFHVYAPDTRGHGESPRGTEKFCLDTFADDLRCLMDKHGIDKADILGFSDGGNIALIFALKYPERVNRLVLNGANTFPAGMNQSFYLSALAQRAVCRLLLRFGSDDELKRKAELLSLMTDEPHITNEQLESVQAPTLVIAGSNDLILNKHTCNIYRHIRNSKLVIIPGDHCIAEKCSEQFNEAVSAFFALTD